MIAVFSIWVLVDVFVLRLSNGLAKSTFDAMVRHRVVAAAPDPRLLIVDIDESSLLAMSREFGRWPWPRDTLATVLDFLERQQPAAIVWDIAFSDADRLSPGGDKAFDEAVRRSTHSHFSVVRLPTANDSQSSLGPQQLPALWWRQAGAAATPSAPTAALIAPVLPAVAASRLGYNNGYPDTDGVLRRYRYLDSVGAPGQGWALKSMAFSVAEVLAPQAAQVLVTLHQTRPDQLVAWRGQPNSYPRVPFSEVFAVADGGQPARPLPDLRGRIIIIGATAPSLHDIHPTPQSPVQAGVDSLATAIDNAVNQRHMRELPRWLQALLAIGLFAGIALWVRLRGIASLDAALIGLPVGLLALSFASLHGGPVFIDLYLPATLGLVFLAALRYWNNLRRSYWCVWDAKQPPRATALALRGIQARSTWTDARLDRLIDVVARHWPDCRIVVADANVTWPNPLHWPELAAFAAIVGPHDALLAGQARATASVRHLLRNEGTVVSLPADASRQAVVACALREWMQLSLQTADVPAPGRKP